MADARHVINIILNARDNTGAALASAAAKLGAFNELTKKNSKEAEELGRQWQATNQKVVQSQKSLEESARKLGGTNEATRDAIVGVERAAADLQRTRGKTHDSEMQRIQAEIAATKSLGDAEKTLRDEIEKSNKSRQKQKQVNAEARAAEIRDAAIAVEQGRQRLVIIGQVAQAEQELARQREKEAREEEARQKKLMEHRTAMARQRLAEEEATEKKLQAHRTAMARQRLSEEEENDRKLMAHRTAMNRQRYSEEEAAAKKLQDHRVAMARQQLAEEEENARKLQAHREAMNRQRLSEEEEAEGRLQEHRTAMARQRLAEEEENSRRLQEHRTAMNRQRFAEETEFERKLQEHRTAMGRQRIAEEEESARRIMEHRTAMGRQQIAEEEGRQEKLRALIQRRIAAEKQDEAIAGAARRGGVDVPELVKVRAEAETAGAKAELEILRKLIKEIDGKDIDIEAELHAARFLAEAEMVKRATKGMGDESNRTGGLFSTLTRTLGTMKTEFQNGGQSIASFDNMIRGLFTLGITVFLQQIVQVAGAAAGALLALASSAATAGAALGGILVAGAAQAIPVIGLLATAASRMKGVFDAVKQANLLREQQSYAGEKASNKEANAIDAVRSAQEQLANASRSVIQAQERINDAREAARRQLQDLMLAEKEAELAARGASLSQQDAQRALRQAIASGRTSEIGRVQLGVDQADLGAQRATAGLGRAREDAATARSEGVEGSRGVRQAKEGLRDAERAVTSAERSLARAKRSAEEAEKGTTAAAGKLAYLMAQMSSAERRLYTAVTNLQKVWHSFAKTAAEPLINAFTFGVKRVTTILGDRTMISAAKKLSGQMADAFKDVFSAFTNNTALAQFRRIAKQAGDSLKPLSQIAINFGKIFLNIGEAAGPTLKKFLDWIRDLTDDWSKFLGTARRSGELTKFFDNGLGHLKAWAGLLGSIVRLFAAIAGAGGGAASGLRIIGSATEKINEWADQIGTKGTKANQFWNEFFKTSERILAALKPIFQALALEFRKTFNQDGVDSVKGFTNFMVHVLIPAVGDFIRKVGQATAAFGNFLAEHPRAAKFASTVLALFLAIGVAGKVASLFSPLTKSLAFFGRTLTGVEKNGQIVSKVLGGLAARFPALATAFTRFGAIATGPWGLLAGAIILVAIKLGLLKNIIRAATGPFIAIWEQIQPPIKRLIASVQRFWDAFSAGKGLFAILRPILKAFIDMTGWVLKFIGSGIGKFLGGLIDVFSGLLDIITGLLTLDFGLIKKGLGTALLGIGRMIVGALQAAVGLLFGWMMTTGIGLGGRLIAGLAQGLGRLGLALVGVFVEGVRALLKWLGISSPSKRSKGWGEAILDGVIAGLKGLGSALGSAFAAAFRVVRRAINSVIDWIKDNWKLARYLIPGVALFELFKAIGPRIANALKSGFNSVWSWVKSLPGRFLDTMKNGIAGWKNIGSTMIDFVVSGVKAAVHKLEEIWKGIKPRFDIDVNPLHPHAHMWLGKTKLFASGGPVPGSGDGDTIPAWLTPGEHVWTKKEVAAAGGHGVMFALRAFFGGGGQGRDGRYAIGGDPAAGGGARALTASADIKAKVNVEADSEGFASRWRKMWQEVVGSTRRNTDLVMEQIRQMRVGIEATMLRLSREFHERWRKMSSFAIDRSHDMWTGVRENVMNLQRTVYRGMSYIGSTTNKALKTFDADPVNMNIERPPGDRAATGYFGNPGERGKDAFLTWIGRGESVLNWAHQSAINAKLPGQETIASIAGRVNAYHAGGPNDSPGYATGRIVPIPSSWGQSGEEIAKSIYKLVERLAAKFHFVVTDAFDRDHSAGHKSPGHNVTGTAVDAVPGPGGSWNAIEALGRWAVKHGLLVGYGAGVPGSQPWPGHGRGNHIHIEFGGGSNLADAIDIPSVKAPVVKGGSAKLVEMVRRMMGVTAKAARKFIEKQMPVSDGSTSFEELGQGAAARQVWDFFKHHGMSDAQAAAFIGNFMQESGLDPGADQPGGPGRGIAQWSEGARWDQLLRYAAAQKKSPGTLETQLNFVWHELTGSYSGALAKIKNSKSLEEAVSAIAHDYEGAGIIGDRVGPARAAYEKFHGSGGSKEYAMGGEIQGPDGAPVPILAHAREWILNPRQQARMAQMMGLGRDKLKSLLGFTGGPSSFEGGGEVARLAERRLRGLYDLPTVSPVDMAGIEREIKRFNQTMKNLRTHSMTVTRRLGRFISNMETLTGEGGLLEQMGTQIEALGTASETRMNLARAGFMRARRGMAGLTRRLVARSRPLNENDPGDAVRMADMEIAGLAGQRRGIRTVRDTAAHGLRDVNSQIADLREGGISDKEQDRFQALMANRKRLTDAIDKADADFATNMIARNEALRKRFEAQTAKALEKGEGDQKTAEFFERWAGILGMSGDIQNQAIGARVAGLQEQLDVFKERAAAARKAGFTDLAKDYEQKVSDTFLSIQEANAQMLQNQLSDIEKSAQKAQSQIDRDRRVATARGDSSGAAGLIDREYWAQNKQRNDLGGLLDQATAQGNVGLADTIREQIAEIDTKMIELASQRLNQIAEDSAKAYQRLMSKSDASLRIATTFGRTADVGRIQDEQLQARRNRMGQLQDLIAQANAEGNVGLAESLGDEMTQLDVEINEGVAQHLAFAREQVEKAASREQFKLDMKRRVASALGKVNVVQSLFDKQIDDLHDHRDALKPLLEEARRTNNQQAEEEIRQQMEELETQIIEVTAQQLAGMRDLVNRTAQRALTGIDIRRRIAAALGQSDVTQALFQAQIDALQAQRTALQPLFDRAVSQGNEGLRDEIADQMEDLSTQVTELTSQQLQGAIEAINNEAARANTRLDLRGRAADLMATMGNAIGAAQSRLGILQERGGVMLRQRAGLYQQLGVATSEGNEGQIRDLTAAIADLDQQIAENTQALSDSTVAIRQTYIDQIQNRAGSLGGIQGGLQTLITNLGNITGQLDIDAMRETMERILAVEDERGTGLRDQLAEFGVEFAGLHGAAFVDAMQGVYERFDVLTEGMSESQRAQFDALITAVLENENAVTQNTQQLDELNGRYNQPQSFSSAAWQQMREAMFNGMGQSLPQYQMPAMQTGGYVTKTGLFQLHQGEFVVNAERDNVPQNDSPIHIEINEAGGPLDITGLAARLAFEKKTS